MRFFEVVAELEREGNWEERKMAGIAWKRKIGKKIRGENWMED